MSDNRAYKLLEPLKLKDAGWKRVECKKLAPDAAYGLYTKRQNFAGEEYRIYRGVIMDAGRQHSVTSKHLTEVTDWLTEQKKKLFPVWPG